MSAEPPAEPGEEPAFFPLPEDLESLSDEEIARLAAGIWEAFVGPQADQPEPEPEAEAG